VVALFVLGALALASCGSDQGADGGSPGTGTTRVTTTGVTTPPRPMPPAPTAAAPMRLLLVGDGLMWDATPAMQAAAAAIGPSTVEGDAYWGFALSRPEWRDWRALWPTYVATFQPTIVAVSFGIHDTERQVFDGAPIDPADPSWPDWYASQVHRALDDLTAGGAFVYWLALPPVGDPATNVVIDRLNQITRHAVEIDPRGRFVATPAALVGADGTAAATDAAGLPLRKYDMLHLCAQGAGAVANAFTTAVSADMGITVDPAYLTGPWRAETRYGQDGPPRCLVPSAAP
jgi:hypothetical protein